MRWKVGQYCFDAHSNELISSQSSLLLEPKASAMLLYFVQHCGKDISRDELMQAVWPKQIVSENAINRVIVQLRKALQDSEKTKRYIVTVPKVGYRFIANCQPYQESEIATKAPLLPSTSNKAPSKTIIILATFTLMLSVWLIANYFSTPAKKVVNYQSVNITPLTRFSDIEFAAELAHNNKQLVYSARSNNGLSAIMYSANVNSQPIQISQSGGNASNPHWSLDDSQLVYLFRNQSTCEFHLVKFIAAEPQPAEIIYYCPSASEIHFAFTAEQDKLYFTERSTPFSPYIAYELDLKSSTKQRLAQPIANGRGNHYLDYHAKYDSLLLLNESRIGKSSVFSLNIKEQTYSRLYDFDYNIDSVIWGHNDNTVVHPGIHPSYHLVETNIVEGTNQKLLSDTRRISSPKRINNNKDYLFTSYLYNRDITINAESANQFNSAVMDYIPAISHDEQHLAFISKRTGFSQVWLYSLQSKTLKVINAVNDGRKFYSLDWSFDNKKLLANTTLGLIVYDIDSLSIAQEIIPTAPAYAGNWYSNSEVTYSIFTKQGWQIIKHDLSANNSEALDNSQAFIISNQDKSLFIDQEMTLTIPGSDTQYSELCAPLINRFSFNIRFNKSGLYCPANDGSSTLIHRDNEGKVHKLKQATMQTPFFSVTDSLLANIEVKDQVSDIMRTNFADKAN